MAAESQPQAPAAAIAGLPPGWPAAEIEGLLRRALAEDLGSGDVTTMACLEPGSTARAVLLSKQPGVICGLPLAARVFGLLDPAVRWTTLVADGSVVAAVPTPIARLCGPAAAILAGERLALNLLQRCSGIASLTAEAVAIAAGRAQILDTRKTTPGLRWIERYAVRCGGGTNHRFGLSDGILIKDNHIAAAGGVAAAVTRARRLGPRALRVEVECTDLAEVGQALEAGAEIILLDNMAPQTLAEAVRLIAGRARTEASGGVRLDNLAAVVATGVDSVSLGLLTHSAPALDLSLEIELGGADSGAFANAKAN